MPNLTSMTQVNLPVLYSFRRCPYAIRARLSIVASGQVCELREVLLRDKPQEMIALSPKGTVPVLLLPDGDVLEESLDIMKWAFSQNDPEEMMIFSGDKGQEFDQLVERNDSFFKYHLDRYKYANRYDGARGSDHRREGMTFIHELGKRLDGSAYLLGIEISAADLAILPFVRQFANTDRSWFDENAPQSVSHWLSEFLSSKRFLGVMEKYSPWKPNQNVISFP